MIERIRFFTDIPEPNTKVMEITKDGVWANPDVSVDDTAKAVLDSLDVYIKRLVKEVVHQEREACAKLCLEGTDMPVQVDAIKIIRAERERISNAIRARGIDVAKVGEVGVWGDKREWVGLTDEVIWLEYQHLWPFHPAEEPTLAKDIAKFARAIEAKLKEKNS